jgi:hypothetical protein
MAMIDKITEQSKGLGGAAEIPVAEGIQNVPVGTMLAAVEQATKVMAAAHKGMHQAQSEELELIVDLFRENPEDFWRSNRVCPRDYWNEQKVLAALDNCRLVPVSDPNVPSHIHRIAKALALTQLLSLFPQEMSRQEVLKRCLAAIREDPQGLVVTPPPQATMPPVEPDKMITAQAKLKTAETQAAKVQIEATGSQRSDVLKSEELAAKERISNTDLIKEMVIHEHDADRAQAQHGLAVRDQIHGEIVADREHATAQSALQHDQAMDIAKHALDTHEVLNPPKPAPEKK